MADDGTVRGLRLTDAVSLGVLASFVPRDAVDEAVRAAGRGARRRGGKLPPHVVTYLVMGMALFADEDYEEVQARLTGTLQDWGCWDGEWEPATAGAITQARQRLGAEPLARLFSLVAAPAADPDTAGAFLGPWRLMSIDGLEWDVPDSRENAAAFGYPGTGRGQAPAAFPKVRAVTVSECASHAPVLAAIGGTGTGKGSGEQSLARQLYPRLEEGWLLLADRQFYCWDDWCAAADAGAELLWRVKADLRLPVLQALPDGSWLSVLISSALRSRPAARQQIIAAAMAGQELDPGQARYVRALEYQVPDRPGNGKDERLIMITTITRWQDAPAAMLAGAYPERWEHETGNGQEKTVLRGPGRVLRSRSPDLVRQELWGYLLAHYAISALICQAATAAGIDPDQVKFTRTVRIIRRQADHPAFSP